MLDLIRRWWLNSRPIPPTKNEVLDVARQRMMSIRQCARKGGYTSLSGITVEQLAEEILKAKRMLNELLAMPREKVFYPSVVMGEWKVDEISGSDNSQVID
ncbi:hypothetical protein LCGC14_2004250 [marine sediment metagenome]|uniref:Uncharacterized protein n=1 Tax=marine sediment metagenome TaxID=412755 RepID=A0A0F9FQ00_9ZZZZ